jgi:hypothetical protein
MLEQAELHPAEEQAPQSSLLPSRFTRSLNAPNPERNVVSLITRSAPQQQGGKAVSDQAFSQAPHLEEDFRGLEPFVDAQVAGRFLGVEPRRVLELARAGQLPAHPISRGKRRTWRFRLSEIAEEMTALKSPPAAKMPVAVPGTRRRNRLG